MSESKPLWRGRGGYCGGYRGRKPPSNHGGGNQAAEESHPWRRDDHVGNNSRGFSEAPKPPFLGGTVGPKPWLNDKRRGHRGRGAGQKRGGGKPRPLPTTSLFADDGSDDDDYPIRHNERGSKPPTPPPGMYGMPLLPVAPVSQVYPPIPRLPAETMNPVPPPKLSKVAFVQRALQQPLPVPPRPPPVRSSRSEQHDENFYKKHGLARLSAPVDHNNNDTGNYPPPNFFSAIHKGRKIHANRPSRPIYGNWDGGCSGGFAQNVQSRARFTADFTDKQRTDLSALRLTERCSLNG
uniref:Extensin-like n=1 Tax=Panagrellus redivivus TaxID=6233 RepID=A0A7E4VMC4_PANRE